MMDASCVTMSERMLMGADGGGGGFVADDGSADVVAALESFGGCASLCRVELGGEFVLSFGLAAEESAMVMREDDD